MEIGAATTPALLAKWQESQDTYTRVRDQAGMIQRMIMAELIKRNSDASCAFLCALASNETTRIKDYFKEPKKPAAEKPKESPKPDPLERATGIRAATK